MFERMDRADPEGLSFYRDPRAESLSLVACQLHYT